MKKKLKLNIKKLVKQKSRNMFKIPTVKKFKNKKKYNRKIKFKGDYHD